MLSEQFNRAMDKTRDRYPSKRGSVAWALWSCHRGVMLLTAGQKVIHDLLQFAFPVLLRWMLQHLQNDGNRGGGEAPARQLALRQLGCAPRMRHPSLPLPSQPC